MNHKKGTATKKFAQIAILATLAAAAWSQSKPDFSGVWKLNIDETEFVGPKRSASTFSAIRTVQQKSNELGLKITRVNNGKKSGFDFVSIPIGGGEPHVSDEAGIITAEWKGQTLHPLSVQSGNRSRIGTHRGLDPVRRRKGTPRSGMV